MGGGSQPYTNYCHISFLFSSLASVVCSYRGQIFPQNTDFASGLHSHHNPPRSQSEHSINLFALIHIEYLRFDLKFFLATFYSSDLTNIHISISLMKLSASRIEPISKKCRNSLLSCTVSKSLTIFVGFHSCDIRAARYHTCRILHTAPDRYFC